MIQVIQANFLVPAASKVRTVITKKTLREVKKLVAEKSNLFKQVLFSDLAPECLDMN